MIQYKLTGNWIGVRNALDDLPQELKSASLWGQQKAAQKLVKIAKNHINRQDLGWKPLKGSTVSGDPRILVDYGDYLNSIKAWRENYVYYAGVPMNAYNRRGIRIAEIALVHEYGWGRNPMRPLWHPSVEELGGKQGIADIVSSAIVNKLLKLRSLGFDINL